MLPIGCFFFFTDPHIFFFFSNRPTTYCEPDEPNQVYKFFKAFQLKPNRLCDSKILDTGCKVHTTESPRSILLIFFLSFFCTHFSSWPQPKSRAEEILILISIQQAKPAKTPLVCNPGYLGRRLNGQISKTFFNFGKVLILVISYFHG